MVKTRKENEMDMITRLKSYRNGVHGEFFLDVAAQLVLLNETVKHRDCQITALKQVVGERDAKIQEVRELERSYTHQLGEMARLCDIVCGWLSNGATVFRPPEVAEACNEILEYVESVRPGSAEPKTDWLMHVLGPDDVFPCVGEFDALRKANQHNRSWARLMADDPKPNDPYCVAVAVTKEDI
jgi:hypothetical protein